MRLGYSLCLGLLLLAVACKRDDDRSANGAGTSAILDNASPEAREALGVRVDYRITDRSFSQWEAAQRNLDRLPRSAFPSSGGTGANVIDRAVSRLESSPKARTAIEASGLTVRDFVLHTIALAQATEAVEGAPAQGAALVPPENFRFVDRHRERIGRAQAAARAARRNAQRAEEQLSLEQQLEADTAMQNQAGIETSSGDASMDARSEGSLEGQRARSDSARSGADRSGEESPPDTTRDSTTFSR